MGWSPGEQVGGAVGLPQTEVHLTEGFWIAQHEVTSAEFLDLLGYNPSFVTDELRLPVHQTSWAQATAYCDALTRRERAASRLPVGYTYRLPTEAEWEYACRAGTTSQFSFGDQAADLGQYGWHYGNTGCSPTVNDCSNGSTRPVGQKLPNPWGIYDLHGNVAEWVLDLYAPYTADAATDPIGPVTGTERSFRGPAWDFGDTHARSSSRWPWAPSNRDDSVGFRVVLASEVSHAETIYTQNFETTIGPEWSTQRTSVTPIGGRRFLGEFGSDTVRLTLTNLAAHTALRVSMDVFAILSWDGSVGGIGPDVWQMRLANDTNLVRTTFNNHDPSYANLSADIAFTARSGQGYPDNTTARIFAPFAGAAETNTLGYIFASGDFMASPQPMSSVYRIEATFQHTDPTLALELLGVGVLGGTDETWGLDNVLVQSFQAPAGVIGFAAAGVTMFEGTTNFLVTLNRVGGTQGPASVGYRLVDGTAVAGSDYVPATGTVTFDPGEAIKTISISSPLDTEREGVEQFSIQLSTPTGGALIGRAEVPIWVTDREPRFLSSPVDRTVLAGTTTTLSSLVGGPTPRTAQWLKNGTNLVGATSLDLQLNAVTLADAGSYSMTISNAYGITTSPAAVLTVIPTNVAPRVEFEVGTASASLGQTVTVPVRVRGFSTVATFQFSLHWDRTIVSLSSVGAFGVDALTIGSFHLAQASEGVVTVSWDDPLLAGRTLADGSTLFELTFTVVGQPGTQGAIRIDGVPTPIEVVSGESKPLVVGVVDGQVSVPSTVQLGGSVRYYSSAAPNIAGASLTLGGARSATTVADGSGRFAFEVPAGVDYTVGATKLDDTPPAQGVSTLDITLVRRQILGIAALDSPYKLIAADVNRSATVSTLDITLMRRVILGVTNNFPQGSWVFLPSNATFPNPTAPWNADPLLRYTALNTSRSAQDFIGIKMGDVNGSWTPAATVPPPPTVVGVDAEIATLKSTAVWGVGVETGLDALRGPGLTPRGGNRSIAGLSLGEGSVESSGEIEIPVLLGGVDVLSGVQFTLTWNPAVMELIRVDGMGLPGFNEGNMNTAAAGNGRLSVSWDDPEGRTLLNPPGSPPGSAGIPAGAPRALGLAERTGMSSPREKGRELMRLRFRARASKPSANVLRFGASPTPTEVIAGDQTALAQTSDMVVWFGRSPTESVSWVAMPPEIEGSRCMGLKVPTWIGVRTVIEVTENLDAKSWREVGRIEGDGTVTEWPITVPQAGQGYYRVRWEP